MPASLDVRELIAFVRVLDGAGADVEKGARTITEKTAQDVVHDSQGFAAVDTGNMRSSIGAEVRQGDGFVEAEIGPTADYGVFVEFGTSRMAAQPFMRPALDRRAPGYESALTQLAARAL